MNSKQRTIVKEIRAILRDNNYAQIMWRNVDDSIGLYAYREKNKIPIAAFSVSLQGHIRYASGYGEYDKVIGHMLRQLGPSQYIDNCWTITGE